MADYFRRHLGAKLFPSYLAIILCGYSHPARGLRSSHGRTGNDAGRRAGVRSSQGSALRYSEFRASINEALIYAALAAMLVAVILSVYLSYTVIASLRTMSVAAQRIANGGYDERVQVQGEDQLAQLAARFNQMAEKLNQVETMRRHLIGDVSHELHTPEI